MRTALACLASALIVASAYGQLLNGSFEQPDSPENRTSDRALHWGRWGDWINRETGWTPTHSGTCLIGYHHWKIEGGNSSGLFQDVIDVPPGSACAFKTFIFRDAGSNVESVEMCLEPFGGGEPIACQRWGMDDLPEGSWEEISISGMNPTKGIRVLIIVRPTESRLKAGAIKFDDASLAVTPPAPVETAE
ncbi:MAG: hypothetical protein JXB04_00735 [Kiritimatiellae bacterium]|nr:hypothetical protein [Kiritimatiellia bacterium]